MSYFIRLLRSFLVVAGSIGIVLALIAAFSGDDGSYPTLYLFLVVVAALPTAALVGVSSETEKQELEEARRPLAAPVAVAVAPNGTVYVADRDRSRLVTVAADGSVAPAKRNLKSFAYSEYSAYGVAVADDMTVIYADARHHCIRRISPSVEEKWITGGVATTTSDYPRGETGVLNRPVAVAAQKHDMLVCTIGDDRVWRILASEAPPRTAR
jgi:NHL repeat